MFTWIWVFLLYSCKQILYFQIWISKVTDYAALICEIKFQRLNCSCFVKQNIFNTLFATNAQVDVA